MPASLKGKYVIRFTVTSTHTTNDDIIKDWNEIRLVASEICEESKDKLEKRVPLKGKENRELLLKSRVAGFYCIFHALSVSLASAVL